MFIQATAVSFKQGAVLIMGPAGVGKSTLALELISRGARLISDDGVMLFVRRNRIWATPPESMRGCLAVRGLGILAGWPIRKRAQVRCVIQLKKRQGKGKTPDSYMLDGISVPMFRFDVSEPALGARVLSAFWLAIGKICLFSELNVVKQNKTQFGTKRLK